MLTSVSRQLRRFHHSSGVITEKLPVSRQVVDAVDDTPMGTERLECESESGSGRERGSSTWRKGLVIGAQRMADRVDTKYPKS